MLKEITNKLGQKKVYDLRSVSTRKIRRQQMKAQVGSNRIQQQWNRLMEPFAAKTGWKAKMANRKAARA